MAPLEKSNEYTMLSAVYVSASNGRSSTGSGGGRVEGEYVVNIHQSTDVPLRHNG